MDTEEDGRWMSYGELAEIRGIDRQSARRLVSRQRWRRQKDNAGVVRVLVPTSADMSMVMSADKPAVSAVTSMDRWAVTSADMSILVRPLEAAIDVLREQLARERERADRAEAEVRALRQAEIERRRRGLFPRLLSGWRNH